MVNEKHLAETARKNIVFYNKSRANFKSRKKKLLAWNDVVRTVWLRDGMKTSRNCYKNIK